MSAEPMHELQGSDCLTFDILYLYKMVRLSRSWFVCVLRTYSKFWAATSGLNSSLPHLPSIACISPAAPPSDLL